MAIKNVLILFNMEMMYYDVNSRDLTEVSLKIKSSKDSSAVASGAGSKAAVTTTTSPPETVEEKEFPVWKEIGSGFFATEFTVAAKYLEITIYNGIDVR